ncbi:MAG: hypothetical protein AB7Q64_16070 [Verrucomicrobiales bacterium]|nr:hypothetical protein [Akkermansiaceae bacterium]
MRGYFSGTPTIGLNLTLLFTATVTAVIAQGPLRMHKHTVNQARPLTLVPDDQNPAKPNREKTEPNGELRMMESNGISGHLVGHFPNNGNPHSTMAVSG